MAGVMEDHLAIERDGDQSNGGPGSHKSRRATSARNTYPADEPGFVARGAPLHVDCRGRSCRSFLPAPAGRVRWRIGLRDSLSQPTCLALMGNDLADRARFRPTAIRS